MDSDKVGLEALFADASVDDNASAEYGTEEEPQTTGEEEQVPEEEAKAETAPSGEIDFDKLMSDEKFTELLNRRVQSEVDRREAKRLAAEERERRRSSRLSTQRANDAALDRAIASGDKEEAGEIAARMKAERSLQARGAEEALLAVEEYLMETPEFMADLGEEGIAEVYRSVRQENGDLIRFIVKLGEARQTKAIAKALEEAKAELGEEVAAKVEEESAKTRSEQLADGRLPDASLTKGSVGARGISRREASMKFINGEWSSDEFDKYLEKRGESIR